MRISDWSSDVCSSDLLAKKAVERGLERKPWVKTSLAPGSKVVTNYYDKSGLTPYLEKPGYHLVGYGCATCIGNLIGRATCRERVGLYVYISVVSVYIKTQQTRTH